MTAAIRSSYQLQRFVATLLTVAAVFSVGSELSWRVPHRLAPYRRDHARLVDRSLVFLALLSSLRQSKEDFDRDPGFRTLLKELSSSILIADAQSKKSEQIPWIWSAGALIMWLLLPLRANLNLESLIATSSNASFLAIVALRPMLVITNRRGVHLPFEPECNQRSPSGVLFSPRGPGLGIERHAMLIRAHSFS